jgi:hypothetical protein
VACAELLDFLRVAAVRPEHPSAAGENPALIRGATLCPVGAVPEPHAPGSLVTTRRGHHPGSVRGGLCRAKFSSRMQRLWWPKGWPGVRPQLRCPQLLSARPTPVSSLFASAGYSRFARPDCALAAAELLGATRRDPRRSCGSAGAGRYSGSGPT